MMQDFSWTINALVSPEDLEYTYSENMQPETDDVLKRTANISVGVVDKGRGVGAGINVNSTEEEIDRDAANIRQSSCLRNYICLYGKCVEF